MLPRHLLQRHRNTRSACGWKSLGVSLDCCLRGHWCDRSSRRHIRLLLLLSTKETTNQLKFHTSPNRFLPAQHEPGSCRIHLATASSTFVRGRQIEHQQPPPNDIGANIIDLKSYYELINPFLKSDTVNKLILFRAEHEVGDHVTATMI